MKRKAISLLLALVLCLAMAAPGFADEYGSLSNSEMFALLPKEKFTVTPPENAEQAQYWAMEQQNTWSASKTPDQVLTEIKNQTNRLIEGKTSQTEKARAIFQWVATHIVYDEEDTDNRINQDAIYTFYRKKGVCTGYTNLANLMLTFAGLPSAYISGIGNSAPHAWSAVYVGGKWIIFDSTWNKWDIGPNFHSFISWICLAPGGYTITFNHDGSVEYARMDAYDCPAVVKIPDYVTDIETDAFSFCTDLTRVTIPDSVTYIGPWAFSGCAGLTSVTIPDNVTEIGGKAFRACKGLTNVTIPNSVTTIGEGAFSSCTGLTSLQVGSGNPAYTSEDGVLFNKDKTALVCYPAGKHASGFVIPDSVTCIEEEAFSGCEGLTSVTIPDSVTKIRAWAFSSCTGLTSVTIPASVTEIGGWAFSGCTALTSITIPDSVKDIRDYAFSNCTELTIYGEAGSKAENYAKRNDIPFRVVGDEPVVDDDETVTSIFSDVPADSWYAAGVAWAVKNDITEGAGNGTFAPERVCTNGEIITFLWRANQKPDASADAPVEAPAYFRDAVNWAYEQGIIDDSFQSAASCPRADIVTYMWKAFKQPTAGTNASFNDVSADAAYFAAVSWAVENGVTTGTGDGNFSPDGTCTRHQVVTFLSRAY